MKDIRSKFLISVKIYPTRMADKKGRVYYSVSCDNRTKNFQTDIRATKDEVKTIYLEETAKDLKLIYCIIEHLTDTKQSFTLDDVLNSYNSIKNGINPYEERISATKDNFLIRKELVNIGGLYKNFFKEVVEEKKIKNSNNLLDFIDSKVTIFYNQGRASSIRAFKSTKHCLSRYKGNVILFADINLDFVLNFQEYLKGTGISDTSISFYMRVLRRILNMAANEGLIELPDNLFEKANTSVRLPSSSSTENYLSKKQMKQLISLDLKDNPKLELARDLFLFSFYMRGMELRDIVVLTEDNIKDNAVVFKRREIGNEVRLPIDPKAKMILSKYMAQGGNYIFPVLKYKSAMALNNERGYILKHLKRIGQMLSPKVPLNFGMAKGTWNKLLQEVNLPSNLIN